MDENEIREVVRERYAQIAIEGRGARSAEPSAETADAACCGPQPAADAASCCAPADAAAMAVGYSAEELAAIPEEARLGLGCGNPTALASLKQGETVLDLGAGGGMDCFLAAAQVGQTGRVIGVDMTPEMVQRARESAARGGYSNVEFRLGEIENLPVADGSVDVVISNCVINLSPDKPRVFAEAWRALRPGGRLMVSDIVLLKDLPQDVRSSVEAYVGCIAGASKKEEYLAAIEAAGFEGVEVVSETFLGWGALEDAVSSVNIRAVKPK